MERAREAARAFRCRRDLAEPPCPAVWSAAAELQVAAARAAFAPEAVRRALEAAVRAVPLPAAGGSPVP